MKKDRDWEREEQKEKGQERGERAAQRDTGTPKGQSNTREELARWVGGPHLGTGDSDGDRLRETEALSFIPSHTHSFGPRRMDKQVQMDRVNQAGRTDSQER